MLVKRPVPVLAVGVLLAYWLLPADYLSYFGLYFAAGALLYEFPAYRSWQAMGVLVAGGAFIFFTSDNTILALALAIPPVTVWIGLQSWPVMRSAGRFGMSYGIYIYAWPWMQQLTVAYMPRGSSYYALTSMRLPRLRAWRGCPGATSNSRCWRGKPLHPNLRYAVDGEPVGGGIAEGDAGAAVSLGVDTRN